MKTKLLRLMAAVTVLSLLLPTTLALAAPEPPPELQYVSVDEVSVYIVRFTDAPLASYRGGIPGLMATNPRTLGEARLDVSSPASGAYLSYLADQREQFIASVAAALNRSPEIKAEYQYAFNGMAVELTPEEAAEVSQLPVLSVWRKTTSCSPPQMLALSGSAPRAFGTEAPRVGFPAPRVRA